MKLTLYNIDQLIKNKTDNKHKAFYYNQECVIVQGPLGIVVAYYDCSFNSYKSLENEMTVEMLDGDSGTDELMACGLMELTLREIVETAPNKEIDSDDFFHKKDTTFSEQKKFIKVLQAFNKICIADTPNNFI